MELTPPLSPSGGCGTGGGYEFGSPLLIGCQMTMLIFLSTPAPADIIPAELGNRLALAEYFVEQFHAGPIPDPHTKIKTVSGTAERQ